MGDQRGISERTQDDMRASGLGLILSISGLHMALVAGAVFWLSAPSMALSPRLGAAAPDQEMGGRGGARHRHLLSRPFGLRVATVRSWVMLAIMLFAVIADRLA